ncbi:MAG: peptidoglycan-binding protein [Eubacteriales bacterium]|nr:peptidoglycan-binding protein [Eubacteriales bacterium]MDD3880923.1 peptidoglycan-binding protein [Eubacteriales bacterium]MDD4511710.1 peptidoglycan-binding protein [Eubacteriales bacterium]
MRKNWRYIAALAVLALFTLALAGCSSEDPTTSDPLVDANLSPWNSQGIIFYSSDVNTPTPTPVVTGQIIGPQQTIIGWGSATDNPSSQMTPIAGVSTPVGGIRTLAPSTTRVLQTATPKPSSTENYATLKKGDNGTAVKEMQTALISLKYLSTKADGDFGEATLQAVKLFQSANGISADGIAGNTTLRLLYSGSAKSYSGKGVTLVPATGTPKPTATPAPATLSVGSKGDAVKKLQQALIRLGFLSGSADSSFGDSTETAVRNYQRVMGLTVDGKAGKDTQSSIFAAVAAGGVTLKSGSKGSAVTRLQNRLKALKYYTNSVDGSFGSGTVDAVKEFQRNNGLKVDGKAGASTLTAIYSSNAVNADSSNVKYDTLKSGAEGTEVTNLQKALKKYGYYKSVVDGKYGAGTVEAVAWFQSAHGIKSDGVAGNTTLKLLYTGKVVYAKNTDVTVPPSKDDGDKLQKGSTGTAVTKLQKALKKLGYYTGTVDGKYGTTTYNAVKEFQSINDLKSDGVAGSSTLTLLYSGKAKKAGEDKGYKTLQQGDVSDEVYQLQYKLGLLGYLTEEADGTYGEATAKAVRLFQQKNGLTVDGVAGAATQVLLYEGKPKYNN